MNAPRAEWCEEHLQTKPCTGCAGDQKAAAGERAAVLRSQGVPRWRVRQILAGAETPRDVRQAAAGEGSDDDD